MCSIDRYFSIDRYKYTEQILYRIEVSRRFFRNDSLQKKWNLLFGKPHLQRRFMLPGGHVTRRACHPEGLKYKKRPGNDLLSHTVTRAVPSALGSLTSVFGMETGVSSPLWSPDQFNIIIVH